MQPEHRTYAEILDLADWDEGLCGDCIEGRCHWGSEAYREQARLNRERCGCARHGVSVAARRQCRAWPPRDMFPFLAICRRTKGHKSTTHRDTWREVQWEVPSA